MSDEEYIDPADQLRADIESAIEGQHPKEPEPEAPAEKPAEPEEVAAEPEAETGGRERDEKGRFVAKTEGPEGEAEAPKPGEAPKEGVVEPTAPDAAKPEVRPPPGFSVATKAVWDTLPQSVRDDIAKREQEVDAGFKRYSGLGKFAEEAERNGTTLQSAVTDYVAVEGALRQDPVAGIEFICQRMGIDPRQLVQVMAQRYGQPGQANGQNRQSNGQSEAAQQAPPTQPVVDPSAIAQQVAHVLRQEQQHREATSKVDAFGADPKNKFFANVRPAMAKIVQAGLADSIEQAYDAACWNNLEIRQMLINEANGGKNKEAAAAATRSHRAAKAVGGSPAPGVNPDDSGKRKNLSLDDEIRAAVDAQVGAA